MTQMTDAKRAALQFKQALKHDAAGDETKADEWLNKAPATEIKAVAAGETVVIDF